MCHIYHILWLLGYISVWLLVTFISNRLTRYIVKQGGNRKKVQALEKPKYHMFKMRPDVHVKLKGLRKIQAGRDEELNDTLMRALEALEAKG